MSGSAADRHVLVVGGAGYVGNVLVRRLLARGYRVRVLDSLIFEHGEAIAGVFDEPGFEFVRGDLRVAGELEPALEGITDVVLLAALVGDPISRKYPELARDVGEAGAMRMFDTVAARGIDRFVFTSTCSNYGLRTSDELATEESELAPLSIYAETKVAFEQYVLSHREQWGDCSPTLLRISTAYGISPRMRFDLTISEFTRTMAVGEELVVYDADTWRPYCHIADISKAIITVLESDAEAVRGEVFNVGHSDENYTKRMVVEAVQEYLGGTGKVSYNEGGVDPRNYRVSFDKIRDKLGYEPDVRVPQAVGSLIEAIRAGGFADVPERPRFYTNHSIPSIHIAEDGAD
jgi:nucleoside-diphosphate-sugar epimerase